MNQTIILECQYKDQLPYRRVFNQPQVLIGGTTTSYVDLNLLPDDKVSSNHARLFYFMGWWIEDLGSASGVSVNEELILSRRQLNNKDSIELGDTRILIIFEEELDIDPVGEGGIRETTSIHPHLPLSEEDHSDILAQLDKILQNSNSEKKFQHIIDFINHKLPSPSNISIFLNSDNQQIPLIYSNYGKSSASFRLAQRCIESREAFIWDRNLASAESLAVPSLQNVISAIYVPIIDRFYIAGIIAIETTAFTVQYEQKHLLLLVNVARKYAAMIRQELGSLIYTVPSIFLSYSHKDIDFVRRLANDLRRIPINVWYDERLRLAQKWNKQLEDAIGQMDMFCVIWSPDSVGSEYVQAEIKHAMASKKPFLSLLYKQCDIPPRLLDFQYYNIGENYSSAFEKLTNDIADLK